jgi:hypothetical protein
VRCQASGRAPPTTTERFVAAIAGQCRRHFLFRRFGYVVGRHRRRVAKGSSNTETWRSSSSATSGTITCASRSCRLVRHRLTTTVAIDDGDTAIAKGDMGIHVQALATGSRWARAPVIGPIAVRAFDAGNVVRVRRDTFRAGHQASSTNVRNGYIH